MSSEAEILKKLKRMRILYILLGGGLLIALFLVTMIIYSAIGESLTGFIVLGTAGFINGLLLSIVYLKVFSYKHWLEIIRIAKERHGVLRLSVLMQEMAFSEKRILSFMKDLVRMNIAEERAKDRSWVIPAFKSKSKKE
ncbi:MAG: hypothetical protein DRO67_08425 [Candidatus Asgardarchaeum californiense]|nr:MAG: hypothetical protein DRO67_08425 [Candidatus Asgardarchaeum californiense]